MNSPTPSEAMDGFVNSSTDTEATSFMHDLPEKNQPLFLRDSWTLMPVVERCDNYELPRGPYTEFSNLPDEIVPFFLCPEQQQMPIGFLLPAVLQALAEDNRCLGEMRMQPCWEILAGKNDTKSIWGASVARWLYDEGYAAMTEHFDRLVRSWKEAGFFSCELSGWRDEGVHRTLVKFNNRPDSPAYTAYTIYGPLPVSPKDGSQPNPLPGRSAAFKIERSAAVLFSFMTFGVHLNGYLIDPASQVMMLWISRRSKTKQTWPNFLDNTVAGGKSSGMTPTETLIKESSEEASLTAGFVERHARAAGLVSYTFRNKNGFISPEVQYVYDLQFPPDGPRPLPNDSEVESFQLMTDREVLDAIVEDQFKPNCALVLLDFFVRHGRIMPESDSRYFELYQSNPPGSSYICSRLHSVIRMKRMPPLPAPT